MKRLLVVLFIVLFLPVAASCLPGVKKWQLVWNPNTESDIAGYKVYYSPVSGVYEEADGIDVGNVTTCPLDNLTLAEGVVGYFVVTAYDTSQNESDFSNEVSHLYDQTAPSRVTLRLEQIP